MTTDRDDVYWRAFYGNAPLTPEEEKLVFESTHKEYMLTLGVFDDGDVMPTLIVGFLVPYETCTDEQMAEALTIYADEMREEAAVQYGRPFPKHAEFWFCETREVPNG